MTPASARRQKWEIFKVVNGRGYHYGVGAPAP